MIDTNKLKGRHIAILVADGFEKVELSVPLRALQLEGATVDIISLRSGRIRGVNLHEPAGKVHVDKTVQEANPKDYDALYIPGGLINPDLLRQSAEARDFVRAFDAAKKPIAALCHGPWVLASAGVLKGRTLTAWPGIRDDVVNAGATWLDQEVVRDRNLVTSRGPQDLTAFVPAVTELFSGAVPASAAEPVHATSAPQRNAPPEAMLTAFKWMPRPSFRAALGIAALALGTVAIQRRRHGFGHAFAHAFGR